MAVVSIETQRGRYPMLRETIWWALRKRFQKSIPPKVDGAYLNIITGVEVSSAIKNLIPHLKKLGLIDEEGKPTARARRWRSDEEYPAVCEEIRKELYPELVETFSGSDLSRQEIEKWFQNRADVGQATAKNMAALYLLLCRADPTEQENTNNPTKASTSTKGKASSRKTSSPRAKATRKGADSEPDVIPITAPIAKTASPPKHMRSFEPALNINIQIHIPAEASADQIDHIFDSMAKRLLPLYRQEPE